MFSAAHRGGVIVRIFFGLYAGFMWALCGLYVGFMRALCGLYAGFITPIVRNFFGIVRFFFGNSTEIAREWHPEEGNSTDFLVFINGNSTEIVRE